MKSRPLPGREVTSYLWWVSLSQRVPARILARLTLVALIVAGAVALYLSLDPTPAPDTPPSTDPVAAQSADTEARQDATQAQTAAQLLKESPLSADNPENRLLEVLALIEQARIPEALEKAQALTRDEPQFQLAQLVLGDLQRLRFQPDSVLGNVPQELQAAASRPLENLRLEVSRRLAALRERPPAGTVPHQFLALSPWSRHAIAIDASRSRLYLFENHPASKENAGGLKLKRHYYITVGKSGVSKLVEGDGKTPLGIYYITSRRDAKTLPDFYGAGALPINYPNPIDVTLQKTGSGIWLHGTPSNQYSRAPQASDGCVVLSNPDMDELLRTVEPRTTPVVIADSLQWVPAQTLQSDLVKLQDVLQQWQKSRSQEDTQSLLAMLDPHGSSPTQQQTLRTESQRFLVATNVQLGVTGVSLLRWNQSPQFFVATFEETVNGSPSGVVRRQYWQQADQNWHLVNDTVLSGTPAVALQRRPQLLGQASSSPAQAAAAPDTAKTPPAPATASPAAGSSGGTAPTAMPAEQAVRLAMTRWADAWSRKDMAAYLAAYAPDFETPPGVSRKTWEQQRTERIVGKSRISVQLLNQHINLKNGQATASFVQDYQADGIRLSSRKTLMLRQQGERWLIVRETVGN